MISIVTTTIPIIMPVVITFISITSYHYHRLHPHHHCHHRHHHLHSSSNSFQFVLGWGTVAFFKASLVAQMVRLPAVQETRLRSLGRQDPLEEGMQTTLASLPGDSHGQTSLVGTVHGVTKSGTRLIN